MICLMRIMLAIRLDIFTNTLKKEVGDWQTPLEGPRELMLFE